PVDIARMGGFDGPIEIAAKDTPSGVRVRGGLIPAGKTSAELTITVPAGTPLAGHEVHLIGRAKIGAIQVERDAPPREKYEHRSIDLELAKEYSYTRPYHDWELMMLAVTENAGPFALAIATEDVRLKVGEKVELSATATRKSGSDGEIKL